MPQCINQRILNNLKCIFIHLLIVASVVITVFLLVAFIAFDINPGNWNEVYRVVFVVIALFFSIIAVAAFNGFL